MRARKARDSLRDANNNWKTLQVPAAVDPQKMVKIFANFDQSRQEAREGGGARLMLHVLEPMLDQKTVSGLKAKPVLRRVENNMVTINNLPAVRVHAPDPKAGLQLEIAAETLAKYKVNKEALKAAFAVRAPSGAASSSSAAWSPL